jgi:hypothetical protein
MITFIYGYGITKSSPHCYRHFYITIASITREEEEGADFRVKANLAILRWNS